ncbi:MAG: BMP family ABC transporter substrate-binding protein, partial [Anaerolineae bacterium]|nr:BMP family ABC transporter substrate-binding protein [Anaerolineae bacterium]
MKKFYPVFAVLAIAALALSACGSASAEVSEDNCADEAVLCVGLVTDVG